ncbi:uncharacterized protein LOC121734805 [Aricia agestis]|uniref:uncharacterized protein LOC121734805 n=1 Tax=Aricia agestis TaxID=91739 RepID=UPI001C205C39|nr:uncharacterized protein LOC121734805 [Aricia agestis]
MALFWKNSNLWMYLISVTTLVVFSALSILAYLLMMEYVSSEDLLILSPRVVHAGKPFAAVLMIFTALKAFFSILSIIGIKKSRPVLIAVYLGYGAFMVITIFVMALLLLLWLFWADALAAVVFDGIYVYSLVKMHDGYESILRGKCSDNMEHNLLQEEEVPA